MITDCQIELQSKGLRSISARVKFMMMNFQRIRKRSPWAGGREAPLARIPNRSVQSLSVSLVKVRLVTGGRQGARFTVHTLTTGHTSSVVLNTWGKSGVRTF